MKHKYLTERERIQIELLVKENYTVQQIANKLGRCRATIYNELKRGTVTFLNSDLTTRQSYDSQYAHMQYLERSKEKGRPLKVGNDIHFVKFIQEMILNMRFSPYAVLSYIKNNGIKFNTDVCCRTIYNYVHHGIFLNLDISNLPYHKQGKRAKKTYIRFSKNNLKGCSIEERPKYIRDRNIYGHWEMDTVYSGKGCSNVCLLVLTERLTRQEIIIRMKDRTNKSVISALNGLERKLGVLNFRNVFKTITCDNGVEFLDYKKLEKSYASNQKRTTLYYCHPYSSCERGSNENANKLIRRWIPKGSDIGCYSSKQIRFIQDWINNYPRKIFNSLSSNNVLNGML